MRRFGLLLAVLVGVAGLVTARVRGPVQDKEAKPAEDAAAAIKALAGEYVKAFNAGDAKAVAAFWTADGELAGADDEVVRGRAAIEAAMAEQFKVQPRASVEVKADALRLIARGTAVVDGTMTAKLPNNPEAVETHYSAIFVREDGGWKLASLREWEPDPVEGGSLADLDWLAGEWTAKGEAGELTLKYTWDEGKVFLRGVYSVTKDGKVVSAGTQIIGQAPVGGVRGWQFASTGEVGEQTWTADGTGWLVYGTSGLPDGTTLMAVNVLVRLGPDAFTWQPTLRAAGTTPLPDLPPIKVTRVGKVK